MGETYREGMAGDRNGSSSRRHVVTAWTAGLVLGVAVGVAVGLLLESFWIGVVVAFDLTLLIAFSMRRWSRTGGSALADPVGGPERRGGGGGRSSDRP
jgi:hypothetical protein